MDKTLYKIIEQRQPHIKHKYDLRSGKSTRGSNNNRTNSTSIKKAKNRKSPGIVEINTELVKYGGKAVKVIFKVLFNKIWTEKLTPTEWQTGLVTNLI